MTVKDLERLYDYSYGQTGESFSSTPFEDTANGARPAADTGTPSRIRTASPEN